MLDIKAVDACLYGLKPLVDFRTRVLVLGSFPGAASLAAQQYYAHPRNQFWPIVWSIGRALGVFSDLAWEAWRSQDYAIRCDDLLRLGLGVWDVYASCERQGSLDADIRHPELNDWTSIRVHCPQLALLVHNGGASFRHAAHSRALGVPVLRLPSTSPANASWSLARKQAAWSEALLPVLKGQSVQL